MLVTALVSEGVCLAVPIADFHIAGDGRCADETSVLWGGRGEDGDPGSVSRGGDHRREIFTATPALTIVGVVAILAVVHVLAIAHYLEITTLRNATHRNSRFAPPISQLVITPQFNW